ncbi:hypothetical protein WMW72_18555 [Paenibacillus filicis]|uniref:Uncharacterized protein n=1 Tax=Paenibacillus filicis TaxID=669464 RepID=A0ABU9DM21_9BACL
MNKPQYLESGAPNFNVCPCCGFQSGYDDLVHGKSVDTYRAMWLKEGAPWLNEKKKPVDWNLDKQLMNITKL